jgi:hypothetical protein
MKIKRFNEISHTEINEYNKTKGMDLMQKLIGQTVEKIISNPHKDKGFIIVFNEDTLEVGFEHGTVDFNDTPIDTTVERIKYTKFDDIQ